MTIHELFNEYNLDADDVRWSLCTRLTQSIVHTLTAEDPVALTRLLWSGEIGDELYDMEERWSRKQTERLERKLLDEGHLRDDLHEMVLDKIRRQQN
jgi:hypothetical protein